MFTSFLRGGCSLFRLGRSDGSEGRLVAVEKASDRPLGALQGLGPAIQELATLVRQLIRPLRRPWELGAPFGAHDAFVLERAQEAVDVPHVDAALDPELRDAVEQLVSMQRALAQEKQQRRLDEALDACVHGPMAGPDEPAAA